MTVKQIKTILTILNEEKPFKVEVKLDDGSFVEYESFGMRMDDGCPVLLTYKD